MSEFYLFVNHQQFQLVEPGEISILVSSQGLSTVHHVFHSWLYIPKLIQTFQAAVWVASYQLTIF